MKKITATLLAAGLCSTLFAGQVINDDLIVEGSECVGFDCVNAESFGSDTLRLKENNVRLNFTDTSSTSSFPGNDWTLTANDSSNGGANKFSIDDITGGTTPFTVEAGAPTNSLYVDDSGRIGIGTGTPVVQVHTVNGNTPTLRLEQDGSSGFTAQTWDVAGNEANFFVRDATNGSTLPFRIRPGAPTSSIDISASGNVGIGTGSPAAKLDVSGGIISDSNLSVNWAGNDANPNHNIVALSGDNQGSGGSDVGFSLENKDNTDKWTFRTYATSRGFSISKIGTHGSEFKIDNPGTDMSTVVVKFAGVTVFKNGHLVNTSGNELTSLVQEKSIKLAAMETELKKAQEKITKLELMQKRLTKVESLLTNLALDTSNTTKEKVSLSNK